MECHICFEGEKKGVQGDALISPCACSGSLEVVHASCLVKWFQQNPFNAYRCPTCKERYFGIKEPEPDDDGKEWAPAHVEEAEEAMLTTALYFGFVVTLWRLIIDSAMKFVVFGHTPRLWRAGSAGILVIDFGSVVIGTLLVLMLFHFCVRRTCVDRFWTVIMVARFMLIPLAVGTLGVFLLIARDPQNIPDSYYALVYYELGFVFAFVAYMNKHRRDTWVILAVYICAYPWSAQYSR